MAGARMNIRDGGRKRTAKRNAFLASRCLRSRPHCSATRNNRDTRAFLRFFRCPSSRHFAVSVTGNTRPLAFWHISSLSLFLSITLSLLSGPTWLDLAQPDPTWPPRKGQPEKPFVFARDVLTGDYRVPPNNHFRQYGLLSSIGSCALTLLFLLGI